MTRRPTRHRINRHVTPKTSCGNMTRLTWSHESWDDSMRRKSPYHYPDRQQPVAAVDLEHGVERQALARHLDGSDGGGGHMSRTSHCQLLSVLFVGFCVMSVLRRGPARSSW
jgi:hypothetical protein